LEFGDKKAQARVPVLLKGLCLTSVARRRDATASNLSGTREQLRNTNEDPHAIFSCQKFTYLAICFASGSRRLLGDSLLGATIR
jgi:hypothetical protein